MKTRKIKFIIEQTIFILLYSYLFLIEDGFIYHQQWSATFAFAIAFFHLGTFSSLYITFVSKMFTKEKERLLFNFNMFIYTGFIALCLYHNCQVKTDHLLQHYLLGVFILIYVVIFIFETIKAVNNYKDSLIISRIK